MPIIKGAPSLPRHSASINGGGKVQRSTKISSP